MRGGASIAQRPALRFSVHGVRPGLGLCDRLGGRAQLRAPGRKLLDALAMLPLSVPGLVLASLTWPSRARRPLAILGARSDGATVIALRHAPSAVRAALGEAGALAAQPRRGRRAQSLGARPGRVLGASLCRWFCRTFLACGLSRSRSDMSKYRTADSGAAAAALSDHQSLYGVAACRRRAALAAAIGVGP